MWHTNTSHVTLVNVSCQESLQRRMSGTPSSLVQHIIELFDTYRGVMWYTSKYESWHTYERVMSGIYITENVFDTIASGTIYMNGSHDTYGWVMWHIWMSHVTHKNESCHICECVMSGIPGTLHMNGSHNTHRWGMWHIKTRVMAHTWMSHAWRMSVSCHTYERVMSYIWMSRDRPLFNKEGLWHRVAKTHRMP